MMKMKPYLIFLILLIWNPAFSQSESFFEQGKEFYKNGDYQQAIDSWKQILDQGQTSAELYFNLGNAYYKLHRTGESIYYFEKALQLSPRDPEIKNNLAFAENNKIDVIQPLPQSIFNKWYQNLIGLFSNENWAILTAVFSFLFAAAFLIYYFSAKEKNKRLFFALSMVMSFFFIISLTLSFLSYDDSKKDRSAIIFADKLDVKSEPSIGSNSIFILHEGTKVKIIGKEGNWNRIKLADGKDGWAPSSEMKEL